MYRILFVCTGNTCRSPMAAALFTKILRDKGKEDSGTQVTSAGLNAVNGAPASPEAVEIMRRAGVDLSGHRAQKLEKEAVTAADLILTMTRRHKEAVLAMVPEVGDKVFTLRELADSFQSCRPEKKRCGVEPGETDIEDPYGRDLQAYTACTSVIEECLEVIVNGMMMKMNKDEKADSAHATQDRRNIRIAVASDHAGFPLKEEIVHFLRERGFDCHDFGVYTPEPVDYTDQALVVAQEIAAGRFEQGILVCGTGIGVAITANKVKGIRAALCHDVYSARMARAHNDSNILTMGARVLGVGPALAVVENYLTAEFLGGRHQARVDKIKKLDEQDTRRKG